MTISHDAPIFGVCREDGGWFGGDDGVTLYCSLTNAIKAAIALRAQGWTHIRVRVFGYESQGYTGIVDRPR